MIFDDSFQAFLRLQVNLTKFQTHTQSTIPPNLPRNSPQASSPKTKLGADFLHRISIRHRKILPITAITLSERKQRHQFARLSAGLNHHVCGGGLNSADSRGNQEAGRTDGNLGRENRLN